MRSKFAKSSVLIILLLLSSTLIFAEAQSEDSFIADTTVIEEKKENPTIEDLLKELESVNVTKRVNAVKKTKDFTPQKIMGILSKALDDDAYQVRLEAVKILTDIGSSQAGEMLAKVLEDDKNKMVRHYAIKGVSKLKYKGAVEPLIKIAFEGKIDNREKAVEVLSEFADKELINTMIELLDDDHASIRDNAKKTLIKIGKPAVKSLIHNLTQHNWRIAKGIAYCLGEIKDPKAIKPLINAIPTYLKTTKFEILAALKKLEPVGKLKVFLKALRHRNPEIRIYAIRALGRINNDKAIEFLVFSALHDPVEQVRNFAKRTLVEIGVEIEKYWE